MKVVLAGAQFVNRVATGNWGILELKRMHTVRTKGDRDDQMGGSKAEDSTDDWERALVQRLACNRPAPEPTWWKQYQGRTFSPGQPFENDQAGEGGEGKYSTSSGGDEDGCHGLEKFKKSGRSRKRQRMDPGERSFKARQKRTGKSGRVTLLPLALGILQKWYAENEHWPYPEGDRVTQLSEDTGLTKGWVQQWLSSRRVCAPMLPRRWSSRKLERMRRWYRWYHGPNPLPKHAWWHLARQMGVPPQSAFKLRKWVLAQRWGSAGDNEGSCSVSMPVFEPKRGAVMVELPWPGLNIKVDPSGVEMKSVGSHSAWDGGQAEQGLLLTSKEVLNEARRLRSGWGYFEESECLHQVPAAPETVQACTSEGEQEDEDEERCWTA